MSQNAAASNTRKPISKHATWAWMLWDWAEQPYPTIIQTFIFATYITSSYFGPNKDVLATQLGIGGIISTLVVALSAPVFGRRSDAAGHRKRWLLINSGLLIAIMVATYFVEPLPSFFVFGVVLYSIGSAVQETSFINYYAMLKQVTSPTTMGRVSGMAWGLGYVGGILLLVFSLFGFVLPDVPLFGVSTANAENIRVLFLFSAVWMTVFTIPLALFAPEVEATNEKIARESIGASYRALFAQLGDLRRRSPDVLKFLIASAVYRDGLAGVFTFGAILGSVAFGFSQTQVIMFGIAANIVAGIGAGLGGIMDDRIGTKRTILISLAGLLVAGTGVFAFAGLGKITYWTLGLVLCLFVGPAQASSRTFLARIAPDGREGELFGLYQTTGRAAGFLSFTTWTISLAIAGAAGAANASIFGILGIMVVLLAGLALFMRVHPNPKIAE
jgi:UMF1 family MFS transporter